MKRICVYLYAALALSALQLEICSAASFSADALQEGIHAPAWAFGQSESRNDRIWQKGIDGDVVSRKKMGEMARGEKKDRLADAAKENIRGSLGISLKDEASTWKTSPEAKEIHPDESLYRDRKHVVRAFAGVKAGDDLNISVGPELILKDEHHGEESASETQPDSALGLGMQFKYDF